jgi:hypothetical protein
VVQVKPLLHALQLRFVRHAQARVDEPVAYLAREGGAVLRGDQRAQSAQEDRIFVKHGIAARYDEGDFEPGRMRLRQRRGIEPAAGARRQEASGVRIEGKTVERLSRQMFAARSGSTALASDISA